MKNYYDPLKKVEWTSICKDFVDNVRQHRPEMLKKQKVHLMLYLQVTEKPFTSK